MAQNKNREGEQDPYILQTIQTLDRFNPLRGALESGLKGDGVHHVWMDGMHRLGIKQVAYEIKFERSGRGLTKRIIGSSYYPAYYQLDKKTIDPATLKQISRSGLRSELDKAAMSRLAMMMPGILKEWSKPRACGVVYLNLLDDERLPILDGPTQIEADCEALGLHLK